MEAGRVLRSPLECGALEHGGEDAQPVIALFVGDGGIEDVALKPETEGAWSWAKGLGFTVVVMVFLIYTFLHHIGSA